MAHTSHATAFAGHTLLMAGPLPVVAAFLAENPSPDSPVLVFDDATGKVVDLELRGTTADILNRLQPLDSDAEVPRKPGRPRLGVVAREVTLLPQHWEWLGRQRGGASATLRRLVEAARRTAGANDARRAAEERTYNFIVAMAGDLPGFEEATRTLFAHDLSRFRDQIVAWPGGIQEYALRLLNDRA